jgi:alkyl hydroperoxide reductase subunit AhpC
VARWSPFTREGAHDTTHRRHRTQLPGPHHRGADRFPPLDRPKLIALSVDPVDDHTRWSKDIAETQGAAPNYPLIGDPELEVAKLYGMLPAEAIPGKRTPADNATVRTVFLIGPDKKIKLMLFYPMTTGRNFDEIVRVLDAVQLTAKHKVAKPANWKQGEDVIIAASVADEDAKKLFPQGWRAPKPYLRITRLAG